MKNPEALSPYYTTHKHWTWGTNTQETTIIPNTAFNPSQPPNPTTSTNIPMQQKEPQSNQGQKGTTAHTPFLVLLPQHVKVGHKQIANWHETARQPQHNCYMDKDFPQEPHYQAITLSYGDEEPVSKSSVKAKSLRARQPPSNHTKH
jgi:hypothetical protein